MPTPRVYHKKFKFTVEIDGFQRAEFQKCSELSGEIAITEHWEGGTLIADKSLGRVTFPDITLERGVSPDEDLRKWWEQAVNVAANTGAVDDDCRKTVDIVQRDRTNTEIRRWRVSHALPKQFVAGDWDNTSDDNAIEKLVLAHMGFEKVS